MAKEPLVSVVTPSYNQGQFLEETILSVLKQDYPRLEYIIIDGGSTDSSLDTIRKYESRLAYWVSEPDSGQSEAINKGWRRARGEVIAYLNSDDTYEPGAVRAAAGYLAEHPDLGMSYGECNQVDESGLRVGTLPAQPFSLDQLVVGNYIWQQTVFLRRSVLDTVGWLDENLHYAMDYDLWLRIALRFPAGRIAQPLANFRGHPGSKSFSNPKAFLADFLLIIDKTFESTFLPKDLLNLKKQAIVRAYMMTILLCYALHQEITGKELLQQLIDETPESFLGEDYIIEMVANTLVYNVATPWLGNQTTSSDQWLAKLFADLPKQAELPPRWKAKIQARVRVIFAFQAYARQDWTHVRSHIWSACLSDPSCLSNRGIRSILLRSIIGNSLGRVKGAAQRGYVASRPT